MLVKKKARKKQRPDAHMPGTLDKAPLNDLVAQVIRVARNQLNLSEGIFCSRLGTGVLGVSYLRAIESGALPLPIHKAAEIANFLGWNHDLAMILFGAVSVCDRRTSVEAGRRPDRQAILTQCRAQLAQSKLLTYVWQWSIGACDQDMKSEEYRRARDEVAARVLFDLKHEAFANVSSTNREPVEDGRRTKALSPYLARPLARLRNDLNRYQEILERVVPIMDQEGLTLLDDLIRDDVTAAYAFLSYRPTADMWLKSQFDFAFLVNRNSPTLHICVPQEHLESIGSAASINTAFAEKFKVSGAAGRRKAMLEKRSFVRLGVPRQDFVNGIKYDLTNQLWSIEGERSNAQVIFRNVWVYEIDDGPRGRQFLAVMDDFTPDSATAGKVTGIALSASESARFMKEMAGVG